MTDWISIEILLQSTHIRGHYGFVVMHRDGCDATLRSRSIGQANEVSS